MPSAPPSPRPPRPTASNSPSGDLLAVGEGSTYDTVLVQRFAADGTVSPVEQRLAGYRFPTIAGDGTNAWLVMVRSSDGVVVSRQFTPGTGWSTTDRVEIQGAGGGYAWPNAAPVVDGRLRFVVRGAASDGGSTVLALQRGSGRAGERRRARTGAVTGRRPASSAGPSAPARQRRSQASLCRGGGHAPLPDAQARVAQQDTC